MSVTGELVWMNDSTVPPPDGGPVLNTGRTQVTGTTEGITTRPTRRRGLPAPDHQNTSRTQRNLQVQDVPCCRPARSRDLPRRPRQLWASASGAPWRPARQVELDAGRSVLRRHRRVELIGLGGATGWDRGLRASAMSLRATIPHTMTAARSGQLVISLLAKTDSHRQRFDGIVQAGARRRCGRGCCSSCTTVGWSAPSDSIEGVTTDDLAAADLGIAVEQARIGRDHLISDEAFVCGTACSASPKSTRAASARHRRASRPAGRLRDAFARGPRSWLEY